MDEALTQEYVDGGGEIEPEILEESHRLRLDISIYTDLCRYSCHRITSFFIRYSYYIVFAIQRKQLFKKCYPQYNRGEQCAVARKARFLTRSKKAQANAYALL